MMTIIKLIKVNNHPDNCCCNDCIEYRKGQDTVSLDDIIPFDELSNTGQIKELDFNSED